MSNYYGFKTDGGNTDDVPGYEMSGPVAVLGTVLVMLTYLLSSSSGSPMGVPTPPVSSVTALGLAIVLYFLTHIADELGKTGLKLIIAVCIIALCAIYPFVDALIDGGDVPGFSRAYDPEVARKVGAAFFVYLSVVLWLAVSRLRSSVYNLSDVKETDLSRESDSNEDN